MLGTVIITFVAILLIPLLLPFQLLVGVPIMFYRRFGRSNMIRDELQRGELCA